MSIRLRRHHILCSIGLIGEGYDDAFVANLIRIAREQLSGPEGLERKVTITADADAICAPCPRRRGLGCEAQDKLDRTDAAHGDKLGLAPGDVLAWGECVARVKARVRPDDLDEICAGCVWLPLGLCKSNVAKLLAEDNGS